MGLYQSILESADGGAFVNLRDAAGTGLTSTAVGGAQALDVYIQGGMIGGVVDETAFTYGTSTYTPIGGTYNSSITALTSGQGGVVQLTATRSMYATLFNSAGTAMGDSNAHGVYVRPGDGTNAQSYASSGEAFASIREGGNVANVTASNELNVLDTNAGSILALMQSATGTLTQPAISTSSSTALASNSSRKAFSIYNPTLFTVFLAMAATATTSAFTVPVRPNSLYEMNGDRVYTGIITQISTVGATGSLAVTEYT